MQIISTPIGYAHNNRKKPLDDNWSSVTTTITLNPDIPIEALDGIESFSHLEIVFFFHLQDENNVVTGSEHPRENPNWPKTGIFAQRKKARPNRIGTTMVKLIKRDGRNLFIGRFDGIDMTPILDIKPVFNEFMPGEPIRQPSWVSEMMNQYW